MSDSNNETFVSDGPFGRVEDTYINTIFSLIDEDEEKVLYRPRWSHALGSVSSAIVLQQIFYYHRAAKRQGKNRFYKFREPCSHEYYRKGDSWSEQLGISSKVFDSAIKRIGQKLTKGSKKDGTALVHYYTDAMRLTYYELNEVAFSDWLRDIYHPD